MAKKFHNARKTLKFLVVDKIRSEQSVPMRPNLLEIKNVDFTVRFN